MCTKKNYLKINFHFKFDIIQLYLKFYLSYTKTYFTFKTTPNISYCKVHKDKTFWNDVCLHGVVQYKLSVDSVYLWSDSYTNSPDHWKHTHGTSTGLQGLIKLSILWYLCILMQNGSTNMFNECVIAVDLHTYKDGSEWCLHTSRVRRKCGQGHQISPWILYCSSHSPCWRGCWTFLFGCLFT